MDRLELIRKRRPILPVITIRAKLCPVRSGGGCVKYLISAGPSLCVRQWVAANSLIRSLSSPRRDIPCPSVRLLPVRLRVQLCRPHFRTALLLFPRIVLFIYISLLHQISCMLFVSISYFSLFLSCTVPFLSYSASLLSYYSLYSIIFIFTFSLCLVKLKSPVRFTDCNLFVI